MNKDRKKRIEAMEKEVRRLEVQLDQAPSGAHWSDQMVRASFADSLWKARKKLEDLKNATVYKVFTRKTVFNGEPVQAFCAIVPSEEAVGAWTHEVTTEQGDLLLDPSHVWYETPAEAQEACEGALAEGFVTMPWGICVDCVAR